MEWGGWVGEVGGVCIGGGGVVIYINIYTIAGGNNDQIILKRLNYFDTINHLVVSIRVEDKKLAV